ncbi:MAG: tetraacyldisaccharide 4'-kinase [Deltaproteobacteria bacterium]|jgi:tetraacyldisaccharide 4'-kinase|nr:tetraacyldisaccharide 4'-kinase [Deltaproteobacteria bacterium]
MFLSSIIPASPVAALKPLGRLWGWLMKLRREAYESGLFRSTRVSRPVISIGNITMGGNGKTPMCIYLAQTLIERGYRVAILSRGYGRKKAPGKKDPVTVSLGEKLLTSALRSGDEPALMASKTKAIVVCASKRALAAQAAIAHGAQILILDDGFQHLPLHRDLEILMLRTRQPFGNNLVVPAGPLRENFAEHHRAQALVAVGEELTEEIKTIAGGRPLFLAHIQPTGLQDVSAGPLLPLDHLKGEAIAAFCGLARPNAFYETLRSIGLEPRDHLSFPDHTPYGPKQISLLRRLLTSTNARLLLTTSKDAVKLPKSLPFTVLTLETKMVVERGDGFINYVLERCGPFAPDFKTNKTGFLQ